MRQATMAATLRRLLQEEGILVAPGAYDALSARLVQQAGFSCVYLTGAGNATASLGVPDIGLVSMTEIVTTARNMALAVQVPVIADADTGYGNAINVMRTVREMEMAGVAAIQLEDQPSPKRCGHFDEKAVIPAEEMVMKIRAACEARLDPDTVLVARTDSRLPLGMDEAIRRSNLYAEAGADVIFLEAPRTMEELRRIPREVSAPCLANMVEGGKTPYLRPDQLQELGFKIVIFPGPAIRATIHAVSAVMRELREKGSTEGLWGQMATWDERQAAVDLKEYQSLERKFACNVEVTTDGR